MSKLVLRADNMIEAYKVLDDEVFHRISHHLRLFKTPQRAQDEYLLIRPLPGSDPARFMPTAYRADRDVIDMLAAANVPIAIVYPTVSDAGNAKMHRENAVAAWRRQAATQAERLSGLCYLPGGPEIIHDKLNVYKDVSVAAVAPPSPRSISGILAHIRDNLCNGREEYFEYFMKWLAHMMQKPAVRPKTAIAIIGGQGTGKGVLLDFLQLVLGGDRNCNTTASSSDTKSFNYALVNKLLIGFDEATFAGDRTQSDSLKKLVTEPRLRAEQKGLDAYEVDNFARVLITSNNMHSAVAASLADRRWLIIECRNNVSAKELRQLANTIGNNGPADGYVPEYAGWFKHHLMTLDITDFDPVALPMQNTGFDTKLRGLYKEDPIKALFWEWLRADNLTLYRHDIVNTGGDRVDVDVALAWEREVPFGHFYAVLEEMCKASYATPPARNRVKSLLMPYGATTVAREQHNIYVALPHPKEMLAELRKSARFDDPISPEQLDVINSAWSDASSASRRRPLTDHDQQPYPAPAGTPQEPRSGPGPSTDLPFDVSTIDEFFDEFGKP